MLKAYGHDNVYIMDGGLQKWVSENRPTESRDVSDWDNEFDYELDESQVVSYDRVKEVIADGSMQIIDCRPAQMVEKTGMMPGAVNVSGPSLLGEGGVIKDTDEIKGALEGKGVDFAKPIVFTCGGGVMACFGMAGAAKAGVTAPMYIYDGSWSEWSDKQAKETQAA